MLLYNELKPLNVFGVLADESLNWKNHVDLKKVIEHLLYTNLVTVFISLDVLF